MLSSFQEFVDFIKVLIENKKLSIKKTIENKITIELIVEYLYKQSTIKIDLIKKKMNFESIIQDLYYKISIVNENYKNLESNYKKIIEENNNIKEENKNIKEENNIIKEEINKVKEENNNIKNRIKNIEETINIFKKDILDIKDKIIKQKNLENITKEVLLKKSFNSAIMEEKDFDMIKSAIEKIMNKEIKGIHKLLQATVDCGGSFIFHKKCDNIPNTLILYESAGKRKFGGFASQCWNTNSGVIDKNCFLFSLDNKKIYFPKKENYISISCKLNDGPSFLSQGFYIIEIYKNIFNNKSLRTYENKKLHELLFDGDNNALSEDGNFLGINAKEYEVFEIIF